MPLAEFPGLGFRDDEGGKKVTFDFTPDWLDTLPATETTPFATQPFASQPAPRVLPLHAPTHPTDRQMASLVGELFAEGSLSFEQLCSLSNAPELENLLGDTVAGVAPSRRALGRR